MFTPIPAQPFEVVGDVRRIVNVGTYSWRPPIYNELRLSGDFVGMFLPGQRSVLYVKDDLERKTILELEVKQSPTMSTKAPVEVYIGTRDKDNKTLGAALAEWESLDPSGSYSLYFERIMPTSINDTKQITLRGSEFLQGYRKGPFNREGVIKRL